MREHEQGGEGEAGSLRVGSLLRGLIPGPWDHDLSQRQMLSQLSHPGIPVVIRLILGRFAEVIFATAAKQNVSAVLSKMKNRMSVLLYFSYPDSILSCGDPGPDYLTVQLTPNTSTKPHRILKQYLLY